MLELAPEGFEERERGTELELAAYTDSHGGSRIARAFGSAQEDDVPTDWAERWRTFHRPVRAGPFWIGPSWEGAPDDAIAIVIDPGLAFGTGAHATTRLCLELLADVPLGSLLDAGCGSGVLSIAACEARVLAGARTRRRSVRGRDDGREREGERRDRGLRQRAT